MQLRLVLTFIVLLAGVVIGQDKPADSPNLVFNGDMEQPDPHSRLPLGWVIYGEEKYKDRNNFTRDEAEKFTGQASLRIHHPKDTNGHVALDPGSYSITAKPGMTYTITFQSKADADGEGMFIVWGKKALDADEGSAAAGNWKVKLTKDWKPQRFVIRDGLDFRATETPFLHLMLFAAAQQSEERTMWIDDLQIVATPNPGDLSGIKKISTIDYTPVDHVLKPADDNRLDVTIDTKAPAVRKANRMALGVSFHKVRGHPQVPYDQFGNYTLSYETERALKSLELPWTRFYDVADPRGSVEWSLDRIAEMCDKFGIPKEKVVLELDIEYATHASEPEKWVRMVKYSMEKGYGFRTWEIGNEVYAAHINHGDKAAFREPEDYAQYFLKVSEAIKAIQPDARIGISVHAEMHGWHEYTLLRTVGHYDFVVPHIYANIDAFKEPFDRVVLGENYLRIDLAQRLNAMIAAYNPGQKVTILDTEWGMHTSGPNGESADATMRNANMFGTAHRAVRLIYYAREKIVEGASTWGAFGKNSEPGFAMVLNDTPERRTMMYWLWRHFSAHLGTDVLPMTGTAPFFKSEDPRELGPQTPLIATRSADGKQYKLVLVNGTWDKHVESKIVMNGITHAATAKAVVLTQDENPDTSAIYSESRDPTQPLPVRVVDGHTLLFTLPPRAVVFVNVE